MRRVLLGLAIASVAAACAPHDAIMQDVTRLRGKPATWAFDKYGYPAEQRTIAGDTVYIWRGDGGRDAAPCTMRIIAGPDGLVKGGDIQGSPRACREL